MRLRDLEGRQGVVIDTMVFIYLFEDHPTFGDVCENLFNQIKDGLFSAIVTPITAAEVLVKPLKMGQLSIADNYRNAIRNMPNLSNIKFDAEIGFMAGSLRAKYALLLPDLFQSQSLPKDRALRGSVSLSTQPEFSWVIPILRLRG